MMGVGDASLNMKIHNTQNNINWLREWRRNERESDRRWGTLVTCRGYRELDPLSKNTSVYYCTPMNRFITRRIGDDSTSTLQAYILPACLILKVMSSLF